MLWYVMLRYVMLCYVMLCYVMLCCYVLLCYVMLCYVMLCYVILCYVMYDRGDFRVESLGPTGPIAKSKSLMKVGMRHVLRKFPGSICQFQFHSLSNKKFSV